MEEEPSQKSPVRSSEQPQPELPEQQTSRTAEEDFQRMQPGEMRTFMDAQGRFFVRQRTEEGIVDNVYERGDPSIDDGFVIERYNEDGEREFPGTQRVENGQLIVSCQHEDRLQYTITFDTVEPGADYTVDVQADIDGHTVTAQYRSSESSMDTGQRQQRDQQLDNMRQEAQKAGEPLIHTLYNRPEGATSLIDSLRPSVDNGDSNDRNTVLIPEQQRAAKQAQLAELGIENGLDADGNLTEEARQALQTQEQSHDPSEQVKLDHTEDIIIDGKLVQVFKEPDGSYRRVTYEGDTPEGNATMTISTPDGRELTVQTTADHIADAYEIPEDPDEEAAETPLTHEQQVDAKRKMLEDMGIYNGITPEGALTPAARRAMKNQEWRRRHPAPEQLMSSREGQEASQTEAEQQLQLLQQQMAELRQEMRAIHALLDRQLQQGRGEPQSGRAPAEQVGLPRRQRREGARQADVIRNPTIPPGIRDMSERARARLANQLPPDALQALGLTTGGQLDEGVNPPGWNFLPSEQGRQGEPPGGDTGEAFRQILSGDIVDPDTRRQIASQLSAEQRAQYGIDDEGNVLQPRETFPGPLPPAGEGQYPNLEDRQEIPLGPGQRVGLFFGRQWDRMMLLPEGIVHGVRDAWEGRKIRKNAEAADRAEKHADHYIAERDRYDAAAAELIGDRQERVARFREKQRQFGLI
jgi:hypothetical protein